MAYTYDPIFAADPSNAANVAANASIIIFDPADPGKAPITITDVTGSPLPNPITVNRNGFGPAFQHATLDRVGWFGAGFTGYFTSYEGMKNVALEAVTNAQTAAADAGSAATADLAARIAAGQFVGAPGQNGSNVLPTDTAIKNAITTPGTETATALSATYGPVRDSFDSFKGKPVGTLTAGALTDSGQKYTVRANNPARAYTIDANGFLVHDLGAAGFPAAAYAAVELPKRVGRIWADFTHVDAGAGASYESLVLVVSHNQPFTQPLDQQAGTGFEESAAHFVLGRTGWSYEVLLNPFQTVQIASGTYTPAALGTVATVSLEFYGSTVRIKLPDGQTRDVTDPRIDSLRGPHACIESYSFTGSSLNPVKVAAWGATIEEPSAARERINLNRYSAVSTAPDPVLTQVVPYTGSPVALPTMAGRFIGSYGPTGKATLRIATYYEFAAATSLYHSLWNPANNTAISGTTQVVVSGAEKPVNGRYESSFVVSGTPGAAFTHELRHLETVSAAATWRAGYPYNPIITEINAF